MSSIFILKHTHISAHYQEKINNKKEKKRKEKQRLFLLYTIIVYTSISLTRKRFDFENVLRPLPCSSKSSYE